jgi:hypothetical protein
MSVLYIESNAESAKDLYDKRLIYNTTIRNRAYQNLTNFNFAEKHLYGRVSRRFVPIVPANYMATLSNLKTTAGDPTIQALNFVVDAFNDLNSQFEKCIMTKSISPSQRFLSTLKAYKGYENPRSLYHTHFTEYMQTLGSEFKLNKADILNFNQFILRLMPSLQSAARKIPFTYPAFVKSNYCPISVSGLSVEIADLDPTNDLEKITNFHNSLNWEYFLNACREYGFMVDELIPWRLVADIGSPFMVKYAAQYGLPNTNQILNYAYEPATTSYLDVFKQYMLQLYNLSTEKFIYKPQLCTSAGTSVLMSAPTYTTKIKRQKPMQYTWEALNSKYDDLYFFKLYATIRFFEEESSFSEQERMFLIDDCIEIASENLPLAMKVFERILNKTFDYQGSLGYIREKQRTLRTSDR